MAVWFEEVSAEAGVDDLRATTGMIVPQGGSNIIRLVGGSHHRLRANIPKLKIDMLPFSPFTPMPDPTPTETYTIAQIWGSGLGGSRIVQVSDENGNRRKGSIVAINPKTGVEDARFDVAVVPKITIKLSVKPVLTRTSSGAPTPHSKKPFDIRALVAEMNSIWNPQSNVEFDLVSSGTVDFTEDGAELAKLMYPSAPPSTASLAPMVVWPTTKALFDRKKDPRADLTMFLVEKAGDLHDGDRTPTDVSGVTDPHLGISLISDDRVLQPPLMAHEAGHFLYGVMPFDVHVKDARMLMRSGGTSAMVPYDETVNHFNPV